MRKYKHVIFLLLFLPALSLKSPTESYSVKLAYLEKFTRFIDWSAKNSMEGKSDFVIGIIAPSPFKSYIKNFATSNKIKNKKIRCVEIKSLSDFPELNLVFIPDGHDFTLENILSKCKDQTPIIVSERKGYAKKGAHINFFNESNHIRFEINNAKVEEDGYTISPQLLQIAKIIK